MASNRPKALIAGLGMLMVVAAFLIATTLIGSGDVAPAYGTGRISSPADVPEEQKIKGSIPSEEAIELEWYRQHLETEAEQELYDTMKTAMLGLREGVTVNHMDKLMVERVFWAVIYDHPEIFWVEKKYAFHYEGTADITPVTAFDFYYYLDDADEIRSKLRDYELMADTIVCSDRNGGRSGHARAAYLWVGGNTVYVEGDLDQSMMSVFDEHASVCAGYTQALQFIFLRYGIPCVRVSGHCLDDDGEPMEGNHTWLIAQVNGSSLHYDVTWDDTENPSKMERYYGLDPEDAWLIRIPSDDTFPVEWTEYIDPREMTESAIVIATGEPMEYHENIGFAEILSMGALVGRFTGLMGEDLADVVGPPSEVPGYRKIILKMKALKDIPNI